MDFKYFRLSVWYNNSPAEQGCVGIWYDSYRNLTKRGPETFSICIYFFGFDIEIGPRLIFK